jgi:hypothetical protein
VAGAFTFFSESVVEAQGFGDKFTFTPLMAILMVSGPAANLLAGAPSAPPRLGRLLAAGMALLAAALLPFPRLGTVACALAFATDLHQPNVAAPGPPSSPASRPGPRGWARWRSRATGNFADSTDTRSRAFGGHRRRDSRLHTSRLAADP